MGNGNMQMNKRDFLKIGAATAVLGAAGSKAVFAENAPQNLASVENAQPITRREREVRVEKLQDLMQQTGVDGLMIEPGSTMTYFSGLRWWRSERLTTLVIPADGHPLVVTPYFEEPSVRESLEITADVHSWHEHESPFKRVGDFLKSKGTASPVLAIEPTTRFFASNGVSDEIRNAELVSGAGLVNGCRLFKSNHELQLMQAANDITVAAYAHIFNRIEIGMRPSDISSMMNDATRAFGGQPKFSLVLLGEASAYPHGSSQPQIVREGGIILMDCGCALHDYQADISRTFVLGEASKKQKDVWATVRRGQDVAMEAAQPGQPAGSVDDAVRRYYESLGYGPGYETPGLSHRTGHGIGMDGHEPINLVHGEMTQLAPGMCFSNEPGIYAFGEFGVRMEDCFYMTQEGPRYFSVPQKSIERPIG